jgi:flagellar hook-associated protein 1 FlgK
LGLNRNESLANISTREYLIEQFDQQQDSIAGVSLDEEIADLVKYQYTYQAASRVFSAAQAMLDVLMNL